MNGAVSHFLVDCLRGIGSLFFPESCPCCGSEESIQNCLRHWTSPPSVRFIGRVPIYSVLPYDQRAMSVVLAAKERGERLAKRFLVTAIASTLEAAHPPNTGGQRREGIVLVPIPSSKRSLRIRGEEFIEDLAHSVATITTSSASVLTALTWSREVKDQSKLDLRERIVNLRDALIVDEAVVSRWRSGNRFDSDNGLQIVVIDDVITSGSTMAAAISAISHSSLASHSSLLGITACHSAKSF